MESVSQLLSERDIKVIGWVIRRDDLEELEEGRLTWPRAKQDLVPLVSYRHAEEDWHWAGIKRRFDALMQGAAAPGRAA